MREEGVLLSAYVVSLFAFLSVSAFLTPTEAESYLSAVLFVLGGLAILFQKGLNRGSFLDMGFRLNRSALVGVVVGSLYSILVVALGYGVTVFFGFARLSANGSTFIGQRLAEGNVGAIALLLDVAVMFVAAVFGEELAWRGYVLPKLDSLVGATKAIIVCSVLFAFWHIPVYYSAYSGGAEAQGLLGVGQLLLEQVVTVVPLCMLYLTTRELYGVSLIHVVGDFFGYYVVGNPALGQASKDALYSTIIVNPTAYAVVELATALVGVVAMLGLARVAKTFIPGRTTKASFNGGRQ